MTRMPLENKTKTALDDTRLLMLGANILLGFQFRGVFEENFDKLAPYAKALDGLALVLMITAIALLTAPSTRHRIAEEGRVSNEFLEAIRFMTGWALLPFAFSLGLDVFIIIDFVFGTVIALAAGVLFSSLALWFWYGMEFLLLLRQRKPREMSSETHRLEPPLSTRIEQMLTEARLIIPGAQALLGFQFSIVLSRAFSEIPGSSKLIHVAALGCMALAIVLLMAPAAYHRLAHDGDDNADVLRTGSRLVTFATIPLSIGIACDVYVTVERISGSAAVAVFTAALTLAVMVGLWHAYPLMLRHQRTARARSHRSRTAH
jgi:DMSO reductase anchor subunit